MEDDGGFFDLVWRSLTSPFNQYDSWTGERDWFLTIMLGIFVLLAIATVLVVVVIFFRWLVCEIRWRVTRERCQHEECGRQWTTAVSDGSEPGCLNGAACCGDCAHRHLKDAAQRNAEEEPRYDCVHGHGPMKKVAVEVLDGEFITIDSCETSDCHGVWFNGDELRRLKALERQKGYNSGYSAGSAAARSSGLATGIAIGVAVR